MFPKKSLWKGKVPQLWEYFCPNCKSARKVSVPRKINLVKMHLQLILASLAFMLATWSWWDWKGIVVFFPLWIGYEAIHRLCFRANMECPYCGFDPFLYALDRKLAREKIEEYWRTKFKQKGISYPEKSDRLRRSAPKTDATSQQLRRD